MGVESFTEFSNVVTKETEVINKRIITEDSYKEYEMIKDSMHKFLDLGISMGAFAAFSTMKAGISIFNQKSTNNPIGSETNENKVINVERGKTVTMPFKVANDSDLLIENISFVSTPLSSNQGYEINNSNVSFEPDKLTVQPKDFEKQRITLSVPEDASPGIYRATIYAKDHEKFKLPYIIEVI